MLRISLSALLTFTFSIAAYAGVEDYVFEKGHTRILFNVNHIGYSNMPGMFREYDGTFSFDGENMENSKASMTIKTASVDMFHDGLNKHLRNADFFDVEKHPDITFVSNKVEKTGDKTAKVMGDLTMLGVTKPVTFEVTFNKAAPHPFSKKYTAGFSASATLDRTEFGMKYGVPAVGAQIQIRVEVEGQKAE